METKCLFTMLAESKCMTCREIRHCSWLPRMRWKDVDRRFGKECNRWHLPSVAEGEAVSIMESRSLHTQAESHHGRHSNAFQPQSYIETTSLTAVDTY